jgi:hypothetical protein
MMNKMKSDNDNGIRDGVLFLELLQCGYVNIDTKKHQNSINYFINGSVIKS